MGGASPDHDVRETPAAERSERRNGDRKGGRTYGDGDVALTRNVDGRDRSDDGAGAAIDGVVRGIGRRVLDAAPWLERPLLRCRSAYVRAYVRAVQLTHRRAHAAPIEPYRILRVDPDRITRLATPPSRSRFRRAGAVEDGEWDLRDDRFVDTDLYRSFEAHFRDGVPWDRTAFFERVTAEIRQGHRPWGCASRSDLVQRCRRLDELYESLREHGFLTQRELAASDRDDPVFRERATLATRILNDEVAVDVGRDGDLLYSDGRNRLAMAKLLGVDELPVIVLRRHSQWADVRDAAARHLERTGRLPERLRDHPDVAYLEDD
ncbi:hypothetical protein U4E84_02405 [Halorubrum sp. AD140]|uniref:hypothetical protein n=1 Tax=Halorubrum sp. AD140 TaxID=3050073 RepID=UPI002ACCE186|nr:hypothetical protein [Halorubrum sp. AD140]MDZ5810207.1 hypothetical protein [Halorubrum sp. AD140]